MAEDNNKVPGIDFGASSRQTGADAPSVYNPDVDPSNGGGGSGYGSIGGYTVGGGGGGSGTDKYARSMNNLHGSYLLGVSNLNAAAQDAYDAINAQIERNEALGRESLKQADMQADADWYSNRLKHQAAAKTTRDGSGTALYGSGLQAFTDAQNKSMFQDEYEILNNLQDQRNAVYNSLNVSRSQSQEQMDQWAQDYRNAYRSHEADIANDYANAYNPDDEGGEWEYGDVFGEEGEYLGLPWEPAAPGSYWDYVFGENNPIQPTQRFLREAASSPRSYHQRPAGRAGRANDAYWNAIRSVSSYEDRNRQ